MTVNIDGRATSSKQGFQMDCSVGINIKASPEKVLGILTNAADFPRWNSTIISLEGRIALGERVKLKSTSSPKRVFPLTVVEFVPPSKMVWADGNFMVKGVRTYTVTAKPDNTIDFTMREVISGLMIPLIAKSFPDFKPYFEQYAADLKKEAEKM